MGNNLLVLVVDQLADALVGIVEEIDNGATLEHKLVVALEARERRERLDGWVQVVLLLGLAAGKRALDGILPLLVDKLAEVGLVAVFKLEPGQVLHVVLKLVVDHERAAQLAVALDGLVDHKRRCLHDLVADNVDRAAAAVDDHERLADGHFRVCAAVEQCCERGGLGLFDEDQRCVGNVAALQDARTARGVFHHVARILRPDGRDGDGHLERQILERLGVDLQLNLPQAVLPQVAQVVGH